MGGGVAIKARGMRYDVVSALGRVTTMSFLVCLVCHQREMKPIKFVSPMSCPS